MSQMQLSSTGHPSFQAVVIWTGRGVLDWGRAYMAWRDQRRAIAALGALDDRLLKDMGLDRTGIQSAVIHGRRVGR